MTSSSESWSSESVPDSSRLMRAGSIIGLPVVTIDGGRDTAEVKDVVFDARGHDVIGFTLNERAWFRGSMSSVLPTRSVRAIGPDAVMIDRESDLSEGEPVELADTSLDVPVIGNTVVTTDGNELGAVVDVVIEVGRRPDVVGYEIRTSGGTAFVPISAQVSVSGEHLVVPDAATDFIRNDLAGFGAAVDSFRDRLGRESQED